MQRTLSYAETGKHLTPSTLLPVIRVLFALAFIFMYDA